MGLKGELHNWYKGGQLGKEAKLMLMVRGVGLALMIAGGSWVHPGLGLLIIGIVLAVPDKEQEKEIS